MKVHLTPKLAGKLFALCLPVTVIVALGTAGVAWAGVSAWGYNAYGQLGNGTTKGNACTGGCQDLPVAVRALSNVSAIAAGGYHSVALLSDGEVMAWGSNFFGQLGNGTTTGNACTGTCQDLPMAVPGLTRVKAIASGGNFSLALLNKGGMVKAWGDNTWGELGDGTSTGPDSCSGNPCSTTPVSVKFLKHVTAIATASNGVHSLALLNDGQVMAWGINRFGQLGDGTSSGPDTCDGYPCSTTPVPVELNLSSGLTVTAIAAGSGHSLALLSNGRVMAWGENDSGQLGDGTFVGPNLCTQPGPSGYQNPCSTTPVAVRNLQGVTAIAAGTDHSLALLNNGSTVMAWGDNDVGALGDGTLINRSTPVAVQLNLPSGVKVTAISAAGGHSLALLSNGTVMAWGGTDLGDLGDGTLTGNACGNCQDLPVAVSSLTGVTQIAAGAWHGFAI